MNAQGAALWVLVGLFAVGAACVAVVAVAATIAEVRKMRAER